jgi:hypothetical protein
MSGISRQIALCLGYLTTDPRRGHSSVGRAPALQAGGRRFDPVWLHQIGDRHPMGRLASPAAFRHGDDSFRSASVSAHAPAQNLRARLLRPKLVSLPSAKIALAKTERVACSDSRCSSRSDKDQRSAGSSGRRVLFDIVKRRSLQVRP